MLNIASNEVFSKFLEIFLMFSQNLRKFLKILDKIPQNYLQILLKIASKSVNDFFKIFSSLTLENIFTKIFHFFKIKIIPI